MLFIAILGLVGLSVSSPLGSPLVGIEEEYAKEGMDLTELKADIKELSREVEEEYKGRNNEGPFKLKQLRAAFAKTIHPNETLSTVPSINDLNRRAAAELFEGDLILTPEQWKIATDLDPTKPLTRRQALVNAVQLWSTMGAPIVYYKFHSSCSSNLRQLMMEGMKYWEERTCITFQPAPANETAYVLFQSFEEGCFSYIGRLGVAQAVNIGRGCECLSIVAHEISHAFGTAHVQSRSDRDQYVYVDTENIPENEAHNFARDPKEYFGELTNYDIPYEFGSMQHYEQFAFAINRNRPSIFARPAYSDYQYSMESPRATFYDTLLINRIYKCTDKCRNQITCYNNGVQHGRDCNKCACPRGWDGTNCQYRPAGTLTVSVTHSGQLRVELVGPYPGEYQEKLYVLQAPAGRRIRIHVDAFGDGQVTRCIDYGMDITTARDTRLTGHKFCSNSHIGDLISEGEVALVYLYRASNWDTWADLTLSLV